MLMRLFTLERECGYTDPYSKFHRKVISGDYVLVRLFDEVTDHSSPLWLEFDGAEHFRGADGRPRFRMYHYMTSTTNNKNKYQVQKVSTIRQAVNLQVHPDDLTKATGFEGGSTQRRFFHVSDNDLCSRL